MAEPGDHRGTRAIQRLVEYAPSSGGLALWVHHHDDPEEEGEHGQPDERADGGLTRRTGSGTTSGTTSRTTNRPTSRAASRLESRLQIRDSPVWTDGQTLHYSPAFAELPLDEQTGWVAHQVLHIALRHPQRYLQMQQRLGDVDLRLFNICADAIVNSALSHLGWLALPESAVSLPPLLAATLAQEVDTDTALAQWDVERLYRTLDDRSPPSPAFQNSRRDGPRSARTRAFGGQGRLDLRPQPGTQTAPEVDAEQSREWTERLQRAHAGDGAHSILRGLLADLPRTRTPWEQVLRTQVARALSQQPDVSWSRPSRSYLANQGRLRGNGGGPPRRMPWEPGFSSTRAVPRLVLVVDVSGSIDTDLMQRFAREIEALTRRLSAALVLVVGDDRVQQVLHHQPGNGRPQSSVSGLLLGLRFEGGGTDFTPLLKEAETHSPDLVVVLTDLDGPARLRPRCPVLWAVAEAHAHAMAPFGRKLVLA